MKYVPMILVLTMTACATAPQTHNVENQRTMSISKERAWTNIMQWFTSNKLQVKTIEKDSGIIYAERTYNFPFTYADCGKVNNEDVQPQIGEFNVFVKAEARNKTTVTINSDYRSMVLNPWNGQMHNVSCNSRGELERQLLNAAEGK